MYITIATHRSHERSDEKVKDIKLKYERQLNDLKTELKTLKSAKKEHAKAIRKNVCCCKMKVSLSNLTLQGREQYTMATYIHTVGCTILAYVEHSGVFFLLYRRPTKWRSSLQGY